jgi:rfaE bifunctional protein nucleotidyltransferase chain/domain
MRRAIFTLGWSAAAAPGDGDLRLVALPLPAVSSPATLQRLAARLDVELSASWLLCRGARPPADVGALFCGVEQAASEGGLARAVRRLRRTAERARVITDYREVRRRCEALRGKGRRIVFTNGVFDLLHVGHLRLLERARACGDALVVGVNSDDSARALKGRRRPVVPQFARAELVAAVRGVDFCVIFEEPDPRKLLAAVRPDVLAKGSEYTLSAVVGRRMVEARGGHVVLIPHRGGWSSTAIIERLRKGHA